MQTIDDTKTEVHAPVHPVTEQLRVRSPLKDSLTDYLLKLVVTLVIIVGAVKVALPNESDFKKTEKNETFKLFLLSFVQNPRVLWKLSEIEESKQKYDVAISYMDTALGLLELHKVDGDTLKRYEARLNLLKDKSKEN